MIDLVVRERISAGNKVIRAVWNVAWLLLCRPSPTVMHGWRCLVLRLFGAKVGANVCVYPSVRIWAPWNLEIGARSTLAADVECYCVDKILIGTCSTVSQYSFLCSATHDYNDPVALQGPEMPLMTAPIVVGDHVWITAGVFVGPGVDIGDGAVVLARSAVTRDVPCWSVAAGCPAKVVKKREIRGRRRPEDSSV